MILMTTLELNTDNPTLVKIAALLRQAESTNNEAEAKAFTEKAQQMASLYSIDLALARNFVPAHERTWRPAWPYRPTPSYAGPWRPSYGTRDAN